MAWPHQQGGSHRALREGFAGAFFGRAVFGIAARVARYYRSEPYPVSRQLFLKREGIWQPLDPETEDENHPISKLDVLDIVAKKRNRGADLVIVVASALSADARWYFGC